MFIISMYPFFLLSRFSSLMQLTFRFFFKQRFEDMVTCFCYGYTKCTLKIFNNRNVRVYVSILLAGSMTNDQTLIHLPIIYGF